MRAVRVHTYGEPPRVDDIPEPTIRGPLDILVEVAAAGLCRTDLHIIEGQWAEKSGVELPYVIGHENAGRVREVGSAVTNVAPGDQIILHPLVTCGLCLPCRRGVDQHCENSRFPGIDSDGGMAELLLTSARSAVKLPPELDPVDVAALADAGLTAYHAVTKALPLLYPGSSCVVIGVGGLGHIGVQCLAATTATTVIVVERNADALELAGTYGAVHLVPADGEQVRRVLELTGGAGAHVVLDFVGEQGTEAEGLAMTRRAGSYFVIGYGGKVEIPTIDLIATERSVIGNLVGTYPELHELIRLAADGHVRLRTEVFGLDDVNHAIEELESGRLRGRAVLVPRRG
ncbi:NAD(P)-dependent alcohol dehydrogenase [Planosporangium mesophilum]|uniref:alcohol dehydrogenase n=1 Tax=Planosporangium mesophilum TaxID=689768 RepID=A0A8J3X2F3_9ACTN|nr:NAD(P)-dependent alcohol dehydrogenase [Planosporangium mesophilum]NJC86672.1 NAD(P)-dependent alcohol dehydrogenase [Planosporangium mesophilum]GII25432.1 alcohol dehydrogenase [Planosporangium mesophilum]